MTLLNSCFCGLFVCSVKASLLQGREEQLDDAIEVECTSKAISVMVSKEMQLTFQEYTNCKFLLSLPIHLKMTL